MDRIPKRAKKTQKRHTQSPNRELQECPNLQLSKALTSALKKYMPLPYVYNVQNSVHLMKDLTNISYDPNLRIASLVISIMYTNISIKELLNIIESTCENNGWEFTLKQESLRITSLIVTENYFKFQGKTYITKERFSNGNPHYFHPIRDLPAIYGKHKDFFIFSASQE